MSTFRMANIGPLNGNTAAVVDPATPTNGSAYLGPVVACPTVATNTGATSFTIASGLPTWIKRVTVSFNNLTVSNASTNPIIQLVTASGTTTSGYYGNCSYIGSGVGTTNFTNGFGLRAGSPGAGDYHIGTLTIMNVTGNSWLAALGGTMYSGAIYSSVGGGNVTLASALTGLILTSSGGATTYSAGNITVFYE